MRNSYKAFVGFEFSLGKICNTKACFSIDRKVQPVEKNHKVRTREEHDSHLHRGSKKGSHVEDAVYSMLDEEKTRKADKSYLEVLEEKAKSMTDNPPKHISTYLKTELELRHPKGQALDFMV